MRRWIACLWMLCSISALAQTAPVYSFGVAPQFDQRKLFATWKPVMDALQKQTGASFRFESAFSVPDFEKNVARGAYDFIYVNPYHLYKERTRQGYVPLVRDRTPLRGIVVVRRDSPVRKVRDLDGLTLAVPSPNAIGASMLIRAELERFHGVRMKMVNARSHSSAYLHAVNKLADAAGGVDKTIVEQDPAVQSELRTIFITSDFPSHPIAAHPRVAETVREQVRQALLDISALPEGRRLLEDIPMSQAVPASFQDYQMLQTLDLDAYWVEPPAAPTPAPAPAAGRP